MAEAAAARVGEPAPDFALPSSAGTIVRLSDFRGKSEVVLFFYPKANTPACTAEACAFRDRYDAFREAGAQVIGISSDPVDSNRRFVGRFDLPFVLVSDVGGSVRNRYGVPRTLGVFPGRVTYIIDREGIVRHVVSSQFQPMKHASEALAVLARLRAGHS